MNESIWTTGVIESTQGPVTWPGMPRQDAERLPQMHASIGILTTHFSVSGIFIRDIPFVAQGMYPKAGKFGPEKVGILMDPEFAQRQYQKQFPFQQEMQFYRELLRPFLGPKQCEYHQPWGKITIAEEPWTNEPSIVFWYNHAGV